MVSPYAPNQFSQQNRLGFAYAQVTHPTEAWGGHRGRIDLDLLRQQLSDAVTETTVALDAGRRMVV